MSRSWKSGSTPAWRKLRARVLATNRRDNQGRCQLARPGVCTGQATQVHHTVGRAVSGDDPAYLMAVCRECNLAVGEPKRTSPDPKQISRW